MFSQLGPLFKATFRQAEQTDTKMAIRKDDPRDQGKRKDVPEDDPADSELWEDSTGVSVESLRAFLINFVEGRTQAVAGDLSSNDDPSLLPSAEPARPEVRAPQSTQVARAMHAYQSQAEKSGTAFHAPPPAAPSSDVDLVQAQDVRVIHTMIADLKILSDAGVTMLTLEKAPTFLESLQGAVTKARSGF